MLIIIGTVKKNTSFVISASCLLSFKCLPNTSELLIEKQFLKFQINQYQGILDVNDKGKVNKILEEHRRNVFS